MSLTPISLKVNSFFKIRIFLKKKTQQQQENVQERGQSPSHGECISLLCISFFLSFFLKNKPRVKKRASIKERKKGRKEGRREGRKKERKEEWREERKKEKKNTAN